MDARDWFGWERVLSPVASREQLLRVHPESHIDLIEGLCAAGGGHIDMDTAAVAATYEAACRAAGGAVTLVDRLLAGDAPTRFSPPPPPGHPAATGRAMGLFFFNNGAGAPPPPRAAHRLE